MQNLDEKIDLLLEYSINEVVTYMGPVDPQFLMPFLRAQRDKEQPEEQPEEEPEEDLEDDEDTEEVESSELQRLMNSDEIRQIEDLLDAISLIPGANIPATIGQFLIDIGQGEYLNAIKNLINIVPFAKLANKSKKYGPYIEKLIPISKQFAVVAKFKNKKEAQKQAREIIKQAFEDSDLSVEEAFNGLDLFLQTYDQIRSVMPPENFVGFDRKFITPIRTLRRRYNGLLHRSELEDDDSSGFLNIDESSIIKEDKLTEIVINFAELRKNQVNESVLSMFGGWIEHILQSMFGGPALPLRVVGSRREVNSFARTIGREKRYIDSARKHGLDHPMTYKNKSKLDVAVKNFEKDTGLKWPFK